LSFSYSYLHNNWPIRHGSNYRVKVHAKVYCGRTHG